MDLVKIANACAVEAERQQVGIPGLSNLLFAYEKVLSPVFSQTLFITVDSFAQVGHWVEPICNRWAFRNHPVTFQNGGSSCHHREIPAQMSKLVKNINFYQENPLPDVAPHSLAVSKGDLNNALVKEFLWIHPFRDGNGRVAWLLQNWLDGTLDDPQALRKHF